MNKKLAFGFAALCATGAFVACGDGSIVSTDTSDKLAKASAQTDLTELDTNDIKNLMIASGITPDAGTFGSATSTAQSSAANGGQTSASSNGSTTTTTSSASNFSGGGLVGPIGAASSSSGAAGGTTTVTSSSGTAVTPATNVAGSCAPSAATKSIDKGGTAVWEYTGPSSLGIAGMNKLSEAMFTWTFEDGEPATTEVKGTSASSTYATSGTKKASVSFTYRTGDTETVECTPLEVKGAPVSGCTCTAPESVDLAGGESVVASWKIEGCVSTDPTYKYFWNGTEGEATFSAAATARGEVAGPTAYVKNSDNGMQEGITCPAVKVSDSVNPEYYWTFANNEENGYTMSIVANGADPVSQANQAPIVVEKSGACITVSGSYANPYYTPPSTTVVCEAKSDNTPVTLSMEAGTLSGDQTQNGSARVELKLASPDKITTPIDVCVTFEGSESATCTLQL